MDCPLLVWQIVWKSFSEKYFIREKKETRESRERELFHFFTNTAEQMTLLPSSKTRVGFGVSKPMRFRIRILSTERLERDRLIRLAK